MMLLIISARIASEPNKISPFKRALDFTAQQLNENLFYSFYALSIIRSFVCEWTNTLPTDHTSPSNPPPIKNLCETRLGRSNFCKID